MDKTILNILFNYKGTVTSREFKAGSAILFLLLMCDLTFRLDFSITSNWLSEMYDALGNEDALSLIYNNRLISSYVPQLIPIQFILSYSSVILVLKWMRSFTKENIKIALSCIINYFFFVSLGTLLFNIFYYSNPIVMNILGISRDVFTIGATLFPGIICMMLFIVVGIVNFFFLLSRKTETDKNIPDYESASKSLNPMDYAIKWGKSTAFVTIAALIVFVGFRLFASFAFAIKPSTFMCAWLLLFLCYVVFYIKYTVSRLKDAGLSIGWLVAFVASYLVVIVIAMGISMYDRQLFNVSYALYFVFKAFFTAACFGLFLLPTKKKEDECVQENIVD